jgi:hypothetical protein
MAIASPHVLGTAQPIDLQTLIAIATYEHERDNHPALAEVSWEDLCALLAEHEITDCTASNHTRGSHCRGKDCRHKSAHGAWSPIRLWPGTETRANANVSHVTAFVFDLDGIPELELLALAERLEGLATILHSTHNHRSRASTYARLVVPLSEPIPAQEYPRLYSAAVGSLRIPADPACKDLARLYYLPTAPMYSEPLAAIGEGSPLAVDKLRRLAGDSHATKTGASGAGVGAVGRSYRGEIAPKFDMDRDSGDAEILASDRQTHDTAPHDSVGPVDTSAIRQSISNRARAYLKSDPDKHDLLRRVLEGRRIAEVGERDQKLNRTMSLIAYAVSPGTGFESIVEIVRPSLCQMPADPERGAWIVECDARPHSDGCCWVGEAGNMYDRAMTRRLDWLRDREREEQAIKARLKAFNPVSTAKDIARALNLSVDTNIDTPISESSDDELSTEPETLDPETLTTLDEENWRGALIPDPSKDDALKSCGQNVTVILLCSEETRGTLRWNDVTRNIEVHGGPFADVPAASLDVAITNWLLLNYGLAMKPHEVGAQILYVARLNSYDPLREYLMGLRWDGVPRVNLFAEQYLGAQLVDDATGEGITSYVHKVSRRWLISAVARALEPGCQVDTVLVLEGDQGIRKSSAFRVLGGPFFADSAISFADKDSKMLAASAWIIELAELAAFRRSDIELQKSFITAPKDRFRPPYGRAIEEYKRRAIFVGTTNETGYLVDDTGHRRYWPLRCTRVDVGALKRDRDQIWAEAVALYRAAITCEDCARIKSEDGHEHGCAVHRWWFEHDEQHEAEVVAASRASDQPMTEIIREWWVGLSKSERKAMRSTDVALRAMLMRPADITRAVETDIGRAMRSLGFKKRRHRAEGQLYWVYEPNAELMNCEHVRKSPALTLMRGGK